MSARCEPIPEMNDIVKEVARETGAPLIDFAAYIENEAKDGIPGAEHFLDHVHLKMDGYRELALLLVDELDQQAWLDQI